MSEKQEDQGSSPTEMTPKTSATSVSTLPPPENPSAIQTRFKVVIAFWAVILFLGFPIWWKTTSIYRAELPTQEMLDWAGGKSCRPVFPLEIRFDTPSLPDVEAQQLLRITQHNLDDLNEFSAHHLRLKLADEEQQTTGKADTALTVRLQAQDDLSSSRAELHADTTTLDVFYSPKQNPPPSSSNSPLSSFIAGELQRLFAEEKAIMAHILSNNAIGTNANVPPQNGKQQISPQLAESITKRLRRSMKYAETYHLAFSLFTPGSAPASWDIEAAVQEYISPLVQALSPISNFTIDTQVQLYAAFSPSTPAPEFDEAQGVWTLKEENLSAFINAAEWPLSPSIGTGPTINFILYVPDPAQAPLVVKESKATSWTIPQWGGVFILNSPTPNTEADTKADTNGGRLSIESLQTPFLTFSHQLLSHLGTPSTPSSLPLRLQTLIRIRAATLLLSASSTLGSLARLTQSQPQIPIPLSVSSSVATTLSHLSSSCEGLQEGRFADALSSARIAEREAERSFFEKSMVGQMYFPDEHKVAVYLPLLGPIGVPLILGLVKEVRRVAQSWKGGRQGGTVA
ncbi:hypothetical protein BDV06DRAFT_188245 [Aspergillus oleicola]